MGTTQLAVFNRALIALGDRRLASVSEPRKAQRVLTDLWADVQQYCLEQGLWNFALFDATLTSAGGAALGFSNAFAKPVDFVHLFTASIAANYDPPLTGNDFVDQAAFFYANASTLYTRYTSNDASRGTNPALWTMSFTTYLVHVLAAWAAVEITGSQAIADAMQARSERYLVSALAIDSVAQLPGLRPFNAEARARVAEGTMPQPIYGDPFLAGISAPAQGQAG